MASNLGKPLVQAARGQKPQRYPVWFMRQAGRYLPEYQEIRRQIDFLGLCKTPKLAAEVTMQPLRRYDLDAAIIFSDILIVPVTMGQGLTFDKGHGPVLAKPVRSAADVSALKVPDVKLESGFVGEALELVKKQLAAHQTLIGFAGAPFTVASYMVEGGGSKTFSEFKKFMHLQPDAYTELMQKLTSVTIAYLKMQVEAGAETLMLFDSWANELRAEDYKALALPWVEKIIAGVKGTGVPVIYYPGKDHSRLFELGSCSADVISIDWRCRMDLAIQTLQSVKCTASVQGNLDPLILLAPEEQVRKAVRDVLTAATKARGHIFNVGHGLIPETPPESLTWVIDEVRKWKHGS